MMGKQVFVHKGLRNVELGGTCPSEMRNRRKLFAPATQLLLARKASQLPRTRRKTQNWKPSQAKVAAISGRLRIDQKDGPKSQLGTDGRSSLGSCCRCSFSLRRRMGSFSIPSDPQRPGGGPLDRDLSGFRQGSQLKAHKKTVPMRERRREREVHQKATSFWQLMFGKWSINYCRGSFFAA